MLEDRTLGRGEGSRRRFLNAMLLVGVALVLSSAVCFAQTNSPAAATPPSPGPALKLPAEPKPGLPGGSLEAGTNSLTGQMAVSRSPSDAAAMSRIESRVQSQKPAYDNDLARKAAEAFKPEITQIGRARLYTPVGTAVARKNPFCLLDPRLFELSW
jgi:hypothetical protein